MVFATTEQVRLLTGLSTNAISDSDLEKLISFATSQVNKDISIHKNREYVDYIDNEKDNTVNGSNKTFYVREPYIGDMDNDGDVDGSDLYVYTIDSDGVRTEYTVDSVDIKLGKFVLTSAPNETDMYVEYYSVPVNLNTPDPLVTLATSQLTASFAYLNVNTGSVKSWHVGKISVVKDSGFETWYLKYKNTVNKILEKWLYTGKSD